MKMTEDSPSQHSDLQQEIIRLNQEITRLQQVNQDLQIQLEMNIEHGDAVEEQLHTEIQERQRAETALQAILEIVSKKNIDLEIILETTAEHGDLIENELRKANDAKTVFLSNLSHELRSPLNTIIGFTQLIDRDAQIKREHKENLKTILRSGEHLLNLINDVISLAKIESGNLTLNNKPFNLKDMFTSIESMVKLKAIRKGLSLNFALSSDLPLYVFGDENKLQQVLINLLTNAIKFTHQGQVTLHCTWADNRAKFVISDTGPGMSPDDLEMIFIPFFQTDGGKIVKGGSGLGLAISRNLVQLMGGTISVYSHLGEGTTFTFDVELIPSPQVEKLLAGRKVVRLVDNSPSYHILLVDDNEDHRTLLSGLLESVNFRVTVASNGQDAIKIWRQGKFDLIFIDLRMPELNGVETTRLIRREEEHNNLAAIPIIAFSANVFEYDRSEMLSAGCNDFIYKPFHESELFTKLAQYLGANYLYEDTAEKEESLQPVDNKKLINKEDLRALPAVWIEKFQFAVTKCDVEEAKMLINEMRGDHPILIDELERLVKNFQFDEIDQILSYY